MIRRIRNFIGARGRAIGRGGRARAGGVAPAATPAVDHLATFRPGPEEEWTYRGGRVYLNGDELAGRLDPEAPDVPWCCYLLDALQSYRDWAHANRAPQFRGLAAAVGGEQERILRGLQQLYHTRVGGMTLQFGDGTVLLNNINVRAILALYHARPTRRARIFLEGLKTKLALILYQHTGNPQVSRVTHVVRDLYDDVCRSLARETVDTLCLPPAAGPVGESRA